MFGSHKRQGREAGLATRNYFGASSMGSSLFSFDKGFIPTIEFLRHPYVLAFSSTMISFMMKVNFNGEGWAGLKKGEFAHSAIQEFSGNRPDFTQRDWISLMDLAPTSDGFAEGKEHAEGNFAAATGWISPTSEDPLAVRAREAARNMPPGANLSVGMMQVTVKEFLLREFPQ